MKNIVEQRVGQIRRLPEIFTCLRTANKIQVEPGWELPYGMTTGEIQEAINKASERAGYAPPFFLWTYVKNKVIHNDHEVGGLARRDNLGGIRIELSLSNAREHATIREDEKYTPGSARQQLWAWAFEEGFHAVRIAAGVFDDASYYSLPKNFTPGEWQKYNSQHEERIVNEALNSGVLKEKFGNTALYFGKRVIHRSY